MERKLTRDRREGDRIALEARIHISATGCKEQILLSSDWTERSVFVRTRAPLSAGTRVRMFTVIGRPAELVKLSGVVSRVTVSPEKSGLSHPRDGMAIVLDQLPPKLRAMLTDIAHRDKLWHSAGDVSSAPRALVVGESPVSCASACRALSAKGYAVTSVSDTADAQEKLAQGLAPAAVVIFDDAGESLAWLREEFSLTDPPQVAVTIGTPPKALDEGLGFPVVALPAQWPVYRVPEALAPFVSHASAPAVILRTADEDHWSGFFPKIRAVGDN